nr:adenylyltransferase/cytidyltransferase family protein [Amycolatopsis jejuensis]
MVTLGVFDGLHRGHLRVLRHAVALGRERDLPVVLTTFDPHPATIAGRPRDTTPVATLDQRAELARDHGADAVLVLPFCPELARTPAVDFVQDVLVRGLRATEVVVGGNFRFGHRGAGDVELLRKLGPRHGFRAHGVPLLPGCSSTRVRELVAAGDLRGAAAVLGRPHRVHGFASAGVVDSGPALLPPPGRYPVLAAGRRTVAEMTDRLRVRDLPEGPVELDFV